MKPAESTGCQANIFSIFQAEQVGALKDNIWAP